MRSNAPPLLPVLRSRHQGEVLAAVLLHPEQSVTISDLSRSLRIPLTTAQLEVARLVDAGIFTSRQVGRSRLIQASAESRLVPALTELVALSFGPGVVVGEEFAGIHGAVAVVVFGSWAARLEGERGGEPGDVDVLVLGDDVVRRAAYEAAQRAEARIGYPVNPVVRGTESWARAGDPLVEQIMASPYELVVGALPTRESVTS